MHATPIGQHTARQEPDPNIVTVDVQNTNLRCCQTTTGMSRVGIYVGGGGGVHRSGIEPAPPQPLKYHSFGKSDLA